MNISSLLEGLLDPVSATSEESTNDSIPTPTLPMSPILLPQQQQQQRPHLQLPQSPQHGWTEPYHPTWSGSYNHASAGQNDRKQTAVPSTPSSSTASSFPLFSLNTDPNTIFFSGTPASTSSNALPTEAAARIISLAVGSSGSSATATATDENSASTPSSPTRKDKSDASSIAFHHEINRAQHYDEEWYEAGSGDEEEEDQDRLDATTHSTTAAESESEYGLYLERTLRTQWQEMPDFIEQVQCIVEHHRHGEPLTAAKLGSKLAVHGPNVLRRIKALCGGLLALLEMYPNIFYLWHAPPLIYVCTKEQWEHTKERQKKTDKTMLRKLSKPKFIQNVLHKCFHALLKGSNGLLDKKKKNNNNNEKKNEEHGNNNNNNEKNNEDHGSNNNNNNEKNNEDHGEKKDSNVDGNTTMELGHLCNQLRQSNGAYMFRRVKSMCGGMKMLLLSSINSMEETVLENEDGIRYRFHVLTRNGKTYVSVQQQSVQQQFVQQQFVQQQTKESISMPCKASSTCCLHVSHVPVYFNDTMKLQKEFTILQDHPMKTTTSTITTNTSGCGVVPECVRPLKVNIIQKKGSQFAFVSYGTPALTEYAYEKMKQNTYWNDKVSYSKNVMKNLGKKKRTRKTEKQTWNDKVSSTKSSATTEKQKRKNVQSSFTPSAKPAKPAKPKLAGTRKHPENSGSLPLHQNGSKTKNKHNIIPSRHLWIGRCIQTSKAHLYKVFHHFGEIESISYDKREHFAFIDYMDSASAMRAYKMMNAKQVGEKKVVLAFGKKDHILEN